MCKRRIENGIDELSEEILGDLPPDERVRFLLEAFGEGKDEWIGSLIETGARHTYRQLDYQITIRMEMQYLLVMQAVYELHTTYLTQQLCWQRQFLSWFDANPSEEKLEEAQVRAETVREQVAGLYVLYHSYRRFATETLGVEVDTWFGLHPNGPAVFAAVGDLLEDPLQIRLMDGYASELLDETDRTGETEDDDRDEALDRLVDQRYTGLVESWEETIAQVP